MGKFKVLSAYLNCEYVAKLPFTIEDNSSLLFSPNCSFGAHLEVASCTGFFETHTFKCHIKKGNKLHILSNQKLEEWEAKKEIPYLVNHFIEAMAKTFLKTAKKDKHPLERLVINERISLCSWKYINHHTGI